jgi:hypothetical protein
MAIAPAQVASATMASLFSILFCIVAKVLKQSDEKDLS